MRSNTKPQVKIQWDDTQQRWTGEGVRAQTLARASRYAGVELVPMGRVVDDIVKARAEVRANKARLAASQQRYRRMVVELAMTHKMSHADIAMLTGVSREWVRQLINNLTGDEPELKEADA